VRALVGHALAVCAVTAGCSRNPQIEYARLLERAASWASSVAFTGELAGEGRVPAPFVRDVMTAAGKELRQIRSEVSTHDEVSDAARRDSAEWCSRLGAIVDAAARSRRLLDAGEVRDLEGRLRAAARAARGGAGTERR
jgi:hypothetical protein